MSTSQPPLSTSSGPSGPSPLSSSARRPTTPLRRISASSLRSLSRSQSLAHNPDSSTEPLAHLAPLFAELADAASDLAGNLQGLEELQAKLEGFNEAFGGYLYGIRMNAYAVDFVEAPTGLNFELAAARNAAAQEAQTLAAQAEQTPTKPTQFLSDDENDRSIAQHTHDDTFLTRDHDYSILEKESKPPRTSSARGRGGASVRGRGRGGKVVLTKRQKDERMAFADTVIQLLPIAFREKQPARGETEKVICSLKDYPNGVGIADLTQATGVAQHRVNQSLLALVGAKAVIKSVSKGATTYVLDPAKYGS